MRHLPWLVPVAAVALAAAVVLPASADTRSFSLSNFDKVDVSAGTDVILKQGPFSITADARDGNFDRLVVEVRGNTLYVGRRSNWFWFDFGGPHYTVTVTAPAYAGLNVSSGSSVDGQGLALQDLKVDVSSGASVDLSGNCFGLRLDISSGASFDGEDLRCDSARVDASSGASAAAFATRSAEGDASSGASVTFHGKPAALDKNTSSGGSVRAL